MAEFMDITLTPLALEKAHSLARLPQFKGKHLRIYLCGKDCDGFLYGMNFDTQSEEGDVTWEQDGIRLVIDPTARDVCQGCTIDFADGDEGTGFLFHNPKHSNYQGKFWKKNKKKETDESNPLPES